MTQLLDGDEIAAVLLWLDKADQPPFNQPGSQAALSAKNKIAAEAELILSNPADRAFQHMRIEVAP